MPTRNVPSCAFLLGAALTIFAAPPARGQDVRDHWDRFRGPNGSGVVEGHALPKACDATTLVFEVEVPLGHSSPVVRDGRLYLTGIEAAVSKAAAAGEGAEGSKATARDALTTLCLDAKTGKTLWQRSVPRERREAYDERNNAAAPTPCCDENGVVAFFPDFGLIAYDLEGREAWRRELGPFRNVYGMGASPILDATTVYLVCDQQQDSFVLALDRKSGKERWRRARPLALSGHCTPIFVADAEHRRLIVPGSFLLDAYDVASGERAWFVSGLACEMKSTPVVSGTTIFINGYASPLNQPGNQVEVPSFRVALEDFDKDKDGHISKQEAPKNRAMSYFDFVDRDGKGALDADEWELLRAALASQNGMLAIRAGGSGDRSKENVVWAYRRQVPQLPSPLLYQGLLYMLGDQSGLVTILDPQDGNVVLRGRLRDGQDNYYASPVAGDGKVYFVGESGLVSIVRAGKELESLGVFDLGERCYATPAIDEGRLFVRSTKRLRCYGGA